MVKKGLHFNLFKELLRTLGKEWKQLFSIVAISFLSVCLFAGLTSNAINLKERQDKVYSESNIADIYINTSSYDEKDYEFLLNLEGVEVEKRSSLIASDKKNNIKNDSLTLLVSEDKPKLSKPIIIEGEFGFMLMNEYMKSQELSIDDKIKLSIKNYFMSSALNSFVKPDGNDILAQEEIELEFKITGKMYHCEGVQNSKFSSPLIYTDLSTVRESLSKTIYDNYEILGNELLENIINSTIESYSKSMFNQYLVKSNNKTSTLETIKDYYSDKSNYVIAMDKVNLPSYQALKQDVDQAGKLTLVFPLIFFLVSVLVISTTISQMIIKQRNQIGCLKAIGVKRSNIYLHYMGYGALLCFIGGLLGFIVGPLLIPKVLNIKYSLLWDLPSVGIKFFNFQSILILLVMCIIAVLCSFIVSFSIIKEKPVETLRPKTTHTKTKNSNPDSFISKHLSISTRMAARNIKMNKGKSLMVIIGTLGCSALLVCGFGIIDTINHCVSVDYDVNQKIELIYNGENIKQLEDKYDEVERIETVYSFPINLAGKSYITTTITLLEDDTKYFTPTCAEDGVTIDQTTAEKIGVKVGEEIRLVVSGTTINKKVGNIFVSSMLHGVFDYAKNYSDDIKINSNQYIYLKDGVNRNTFKNLLIEQENLQGIMTLDDIKSRADDVMSSIKLMTNVIKVFAILLSVVVIYNLTSLNISKMSRDIATMKVLGFSYHQISGTLIKEIMFDTILGTSLGLFLGFPMTVLVMMVNKTELLTFLYHVSWQSFVISFVIALVTSLITSLILNLKSKRIKMVESLKSVE